MAYTANRLRCRAKRQMFVDDPADATTARYISPDGAATFADMRDFASLLVGLLFYTGTGVLTFKIFGATSAAGAGATVIAVHAAPTDADAQGDTLWLEITAEQLRALGADFRYVAVEIDNDAAGDVNIFSFEFGDPRFAKDELTDDAIA
jgi:hypothetical protein